MNNNKIMDFNIKKKTLSLSNDKSPFYRFINARKNIRYMNDNICKTTSKINKVNNNLITSKKTKQKNGKKDKIKANSIKLLRDQLFIISRFYKKNVPNDINYEYSNSLLNTFGSRNFCRKNRDKMNINLFTQFSSNLYFYKTSDLNGNKNNKISRKKMKGSCNKNILPKINIILRKNTKS